MFDIYNIITKHCITYLTNILYYRYYNTKLRTKPLNIIFYKNHVKLVKVNNMYNTIMYNTIMYYNTIY